MEEIVARIQKRADKGLNRIIIPKIIIEKYGRDFYLDIMKDGRMLLTPIKKEIKKEEDK